ncbi:hypothetical protein RND71_039825 [Anisodus tanguticus]|uniref:NAC domain-containing protein n=1 Tax=Anisodus tanguticus TaxID=243964 RepID=A0AAE1QWH4_9SOLA|nr:hypothetical protein RND71_039825 [Anisodus tanguticus]
MENIKEGFCFRPADAQVFMFLLRFIARQDMNDSEFITTNVYVYGKQEPWNIYDHGVPCGDDDGDNDCSQYLFFITKLKKKNKSMYNCNIGNSKTRAKQLERRADR